MTKPAPRASAADTLAYLQAAQARLDAQIKAEPPEILAENGNLLVGRYDPNGRWTVKPVRGGVPDAPVERHSPFCAAPTYRCNCPPVDVAKFQADTIGLKMTGSSPPRPTMSRADLREIKVKHPDEDGLPLTPELALDPLPVFEPLDVPVPTTHLTSAKATSTDPHLTCKKAESVAKLARDRAQAKLKKAEARIAELEAQLAATQTPKAARKPKR